MNPVKELVKKILLEDTRASDLSVGKSVKIVGDDTIWTVSSIDSDGYQALLTSKDGSKKRVDINKIDTDI